LTVRDKTGERSLWLRGASGCTAQVQLVPGKMLRAGADGFLVQISGAMALFARSDDELAFIIAHELAHNILSHGSKLRDAGVARGLRGQFGRSAKLVRASEEEADRLGLFLSARAGYEIAMVPAFWARFGRATSTGLLDDQSHPDWRARQRASILTITEIVQRKSQAMALDPRSVMDAH
jgi:predicted Zn-dependent protease